MGRIMVLLAMLLPGAAQAAWQQASSAHFVIYADTSEAAIRRFSERLERYHAAMARVTKVALEEPSPSNRVTVFVVGSGKDVRRLYGEGSRYVAGFYVPRAAGSVAIVPRIGSDNDFSMVVLLHEYAHHFLLSASSFPLPRWLAEGSAEFMAASRFDSKGGVSIGRGAWYRAGELVYPGAIRDVSATELLESVKRIPGRRDAFYGKSWLLFHYLTFDQQRKGQLDRYVGLLMQGKSSRDAGLEAFGDLDRLNVDLDKYLYATSYYMQLPADLLTIGPVVVRRLGAGEAAMMPVRIRSERGVKPEQAQEILAEAHAVAARYPGDPAVLAALAEAEYDAGNDREAVAAADEALAADPALVNAHVQKGLALFRLAGMAEPDDAPAAYTRARAAFLALNRVENNHPLPLLYNYRILINQGEEPNELAVRGLARAAELAPFDLGLRMTLALELLYSGDRAGARANLGPVAYNPHGGLLAESAQRALDRMESDPQWNGRGVEVPEYKDEDDESVGPEVQ